MKITNTNDYLRKMVPCLPPPHQFLITPPVANLPEDQLADLLHKVRSYQEFNPDNDPYQEHDFGMVEIEGEKYYWKFDYYDDDFQFFKENGNRTLTLMHSSDY